MGILGWLRHRARGFRDFAPSLAPHDVWELVPSCDAPSFFRALQSLGITNGVLAIEGPVDEAFCRWLELNAATSGLPIRWGTILPTLEWRYVPLEPHLLTTIAGLPFSDPPCIHLYVYDADGLVLEWYDAFSDPLWLAHRVGPSLPTLSETPIDPEFSVGG